MPHHEVVIVGGGPAGLSTAIFLSHADPRLTDRIVVLEKESYPRDKFCAGGIGARGDRLLDLVGATVDVPSVWVDGISLTLSGGDLLEREGRIGRVVRRIEYDHELANVARRRGIRVIEGAKVTGVRFGSSSATVDSSAGTFEGRVVVGADGVGSSVRKALGLPAGKLRAQVVELDTEPVATDGPRDILHFDAADRELPGYSWDFPTVVAGEPLVCRGVYHLKVDDRDVDLRALLARRLSDRGLDIARYKLKRFAERGFDLHEPYARPHVVLVGEAAGIDPVTGEGIAQAIEYGWFAGAYLAEKLREGDLGFSDWRPRLSKAPVGFDLGVRTRLMPWFFGPRRPVLERFLLDTPAFVAAGIQHFAGKPVSRWKLARAVASAALHVAMGLGSGEKATAAPSST